MAWDTNGPEVNQHDRKENLCKKDVFLADFWNGTFNDSNHIGLILSEKWNANAWCVRVLIELIGLLEEDDKERRRIAKEVEKEMEEAMQNDAAA